MDNDEKQWILSTRPVTHWATRITTGLQAHLLRSTITAHTFTYVYAPNVIVARSTSRITVPVRPWFATERTTSYLQRVSANHPLIQTRCNKFTESACSTPSIRFHAERARLKYFLTLYHTPFIYTWPSFPHLGIYALFIHTKPFRLYLHPL